MNDVLRSNTRKILHIFYGILISIILFINTSFYPISAFFGEVDRETVILYGWKKIIEIVEREKKFHATDRVVFSDYRLGSLYIFHSSDFEADVVMEGRRTQFDIWRDQKNSFSRNTLIIADKDFPIGQKFLSMFETIEFVRDIEIHIGKKLVRKYQIFLATTT